MILKRYAERTESLINKEKLGLNTNPNFKPNSPTLTLPWPYPSIDPSPNTNPNFVWP